MSLTFADDERPEPAATILSPSGIRCTRGLPPAKRALDVLLSLILLVPLAFVGLVLLALNPFLNPGPLLYGQIRIGRGERPFRIHKFRSMLGPGGDGRGRSAPGDETHRITRLGAFMRSRRIDELPQIVNVLRGEMSLVGPRPETVGLYARYVRELPSFRLRQVVRPGISGLAQVQFGYADDYRSTRFKLRYDLLYVRNRSFSMEARVLLHTVRVMVTGFGAR